MKEREEFVDVGNLSEDFMGVRRLCYHGSGQSMATGVTAGA